MSVMKLATWPLKLRRGTSGTNQERGRDVSNWWSPLLFWSWYFGELCLFGVWRRHITEPAAGVTTLFVVHSSVLKGIEWRGGAAHHFPSRSQDLKHRDLFLWGNGRIVVCGCTWKVLQIRWTSRLLQVLKEKLLRCIGWDRLPARRLTVHERILFDTFATRNVSAFLFQFFYSL